MERKKTIALVAHDNMKPDLVEWADWNRELLLCHSLVCTGTTGRMVADVLIGKKGDGNAGSTSGCSSRVPSAATSSWGR